MLRNLRSAFGGDTASDLRSSLENTLKDNSKSGAFSQTERFMLHNILQFSSKRIEDVMVPRADIVGIEATASLAELMVTFEEAGHSRLVVHDETLDNPRGMIHIKDLQAWLTRRVKKRRHKPNDEAEKPKAKSNGKRGPKTAPKGPEWSFYPSDFRRTIANSRMIRDILYVPPSMRAVDLLLKMQSTHTHMAVVVDEYGGTDGLVTIEDLVEEIVGDIEDEHDTDDGPLVSEIGDGAFAIDARAPVGEVETALGLSLALADDDEEYDTIGGLIVSLIGRVPGRREIIKHPAGVEFEIIDGDPRRVKRLRVQTNIAVPYGLNRRGPGLAPIPIPIQIPIQIQLPAQIPKPNDGPQRRSGMNWFRRFIAAITVSWGWRRLLVACFAGAILALALAPVFFLPALFISFPILVWLLDGVTEPGPDDRRLGIYIQAFGIGWAFGFGYFLAGLYWVGFAFLVDAADFAWMLPFVAVALPGGLAIFIGLAAVITRALAGLGGSRGAARCLVLAASWTAIEAARGTLFTGFAWNRIGQAMAGSDALLQGAAFVGDLGLTFFLVAVASAPATLADREGLWRGWRSTVIALGALGALWVAGDYRLSLAGDENVDGVRLRIVQPAISQKEKWIPANRSRIIAEYLELSDTATSPQTMGVDGVTYLVWPETALPLLLQSEPGVIAAIAALLPANTVLLTGGVRTAPRPGGGRDVFNSVLAFDGEGRLLDRYDKRRLVPFGEFLPFQELLESWGIGS